MTHSELFSTASSTPIDIATPYLSLSPTHVLWQGKKMLSFASHDYLGISQHPELKKSAVKSILQYGSGPCFAEAAGSYSEFQHNIEEHCALALGMQETSFFSSRSNALSYLLVALRTTDGILLLDEESDPLLRLASKVWTGKTLKYSSLNIKTLSQALERHRDACGPKLIFCESISSFSGKTPDLNSIYALAKKHEALVLIDDSNALGAKGINGLGLAAPSSSVDFLLYALDRGAGCTGALLASNFKMKRLLKVPSFQLRDSALAYSALGAIESALELIPQFEGERKQLQQRCHFLKNRLQELGAPIETESHFFCFPFVQKEQAVAFWSSLAENQILGELFTSLQRFCVRLIINTAHTPEDLNELVTVLGSAR